MNTSAAKMPLDLNFLSHGTLGMEDLEKSTRFFREFLGIDVVRTSNISLAIRLGSNTSIACVAMGKKIWEAEREGKEHSHFGLDVPTPEDVDEAHRLALKYKDVYEIRDVGDIVETDTGKSFMLEDLNNNYWEILSNAGRGFVDSFKAGSSADLL